MEKIIFALNHSFFPTIAIPTNICSRVGTRLERSPNCSEVSSMNDLLLKTVFNKILLTMYYAKEGPSPASDLF